MVPVHGTVLTLITHEPPLQVWRFSEVCVVRCGHGSDVVGGVPSLLQTFSPVKDSNHDSRRQDANEVSM